VRSTLDELALAGRFLTGLRRFLSVTYSPDECRAIVAERLRIREASFVALVRHGVFARPAGPYGWLMRQAGIEFGDVERLVAADGLDAALSRLHDAGVRLTLDEFKGRRPIRRGTASYQARAEDFDSPLRAGHFRGRTSGSRTGSGARLVLDLDEIGFEAAYDSIFLDAFGLRQRPQALWRPVPPGTAGLKAALRLARLGVPLDRWFSQAPLAFSADWKHAAFARAVGVASRALGRPLPRPEYVPPHRADIVAGWLADQASAGRPAHLNTTASAAVRVVGAAADRGLDVAGTSFRVGGEPLSSERARRIRAAGCDAVAHYAMAEAGRLAVACRNREHVDEVHILADKVVLLARPCETIRGDRIVGLVVTTLQPGIPKLMINVETGDLGVLGSRRCGCEWEALGCSQHLHTIRSYEKLTSEGMHFVGADLLAIVEEVLPRRFGGESTDYQFVEQEVDGLPQVSLVMSPRLPAVDPAEVARVVIDALAARGAAHRMMAGVWRDGRTLRLDRREPHGTATGKTPVLHVRPSEARS